MAAAMTRVGGIAGVAAVVCYVCFFLPLPMGIQRLFAFAFGPLLVVAFLGLYQAIAKHRNGPALQVGVVFGIIAGALVNALLVVQLANGSWNEASLAAATTDAARETAQWVFQATNRVQAAMDVSFDIFITVAAITLGVAMLSHPKFGKIFGITGIMVGGLLLGLNLYTFPNAPAESGLFDAGPAIGLWYLAVSARMLGLYSWVKT
jgi:hypothetical protein